MEGFPVAIGVMVNVDKARRLVRGRRPNATLSTSWARRQIRKGEVRVNRKHWKRGKLKDEPVILLNICGILTMIDGWHRARRAFRDGLKIIPAVILTTAQAQQCGVHTHLFKKKRRK